MKIAGKRIPKGTLLLASGMLAVSVCSLLMTAALRANRMNELQSRDFYSEKARKFTVMECEDTAFWPEFLDGIEGDLALYHQVWDEAIDIRAVYPKGDIAEPDLVSGRFFSEEDAFGEIPAAVVGRDFEPSLIEKDGQRYFPYKGTSYLVLGVMGSAWKSRIDQMVYLDFASGLELAGSDGEYVADAGKTETLEYFLGALRTEMAVRGKLAVAIDDDEFGMQMMYSGEGFGTALYALVFLSLFLSVVVITAQWMVYRKKAAGIRQMLGASQMEAAFAVVKSFLAVTAAAWVPGALAGTWIAWQAGLLTLRAGDFLLSAAVTLVSGGLALLFPLWNCIRQEISTKMR